MRAIDLSYTAESPDLVVAEIPVPLPAAHQVLIKVVAAGVNRPDILQRQGLYPPPAGSSAILGLEVSGTIAAVGNEVSHFKIGDAVCALLTGGGYAEYCLASAVCCLPIPVGFSFIQAAAIPETFFTVWNTLFNQAHLQTGDSLLIHGGSSGIGTTAIQLAKAFGASVIVTVGNDDKAQYCLKLGANTAINYRQQDFVDEIKSLTHGRGVNIVLDMVGGDYLPRNLKCLAVDGHLLQIAIANGSHSEINLAAVLMKRLTIIGSTLRAREDQYKAQIARQLRQHVWPLLAIGRIKPVIHSTFPLTEAAQAHRLMESSQHIGKIILEI